jgi:hypothetical protein
MFKSFETLHVLVEDRGDFPDCHFGQILGIEFDKLSVNQSIKLREDMLTTLRPSVVNRILFGQFPLLGAKLASTALWATVF